MTIVGFVMSTELLALLSSGPGGAEHPKGPQSSCPGQDPRALHRSADSHPLCFTGSTVAVPEVLKLLSTREDGAALEMATERGRGGQS